MSSTRNAQEEIWLDKGLDEFKVIIDGLNLDQYESAKLRIKKLCTTPISSLNDKPLLTLLTCHFKGCAPEEKYRFAVTIEDKDFYIYINRNFSIIDVLYRNNVVLSFKVNDSLISQPLEVKTKSQSAINLLDKFFQDNFIPSTISQSAKRQRISDTGYETKQVEEQKFSLADWQRNLYQLRGKTSSEVLTSLEILSSQVIPFPTKLDSRELILKVEKKEDANDSYYYAEALSNSILYIVTISEYYRKKISGNLLLKITATMIKGQNDFVRGELNDVRSIAGISGNDILKELAMPLLRCMLPGKSVSLADGSYFLSGDAKKQAVRKISLRFLSALVSGQTWYERFFKSQSNTMFKLAEGKLTTRYEGKITQNGKNRLKALKYVSGFLLENLYPCLQKQSILSQKQIDSDRKQLAEVELPKNVWLKEFKTKLDEKGFNYALMKKIEDFSSPTDRYMVAQRENKEVKTVLNQLDSPHENIDNISTLFWKLVYLTQDVTAPTTLHRLAKKYFPKRVNDAKESNPFKDSKLTIRELGSAIYGASKQSSQVQQELFQFYDIISCGVSSSSSEPYREACDGLKELSTHVHTLLWQSLYWELTVQEGEHKDDPDDEDVEMKKSTRQRSQ